MSIEKGNVEDKKNNENVIDNKELLAQMQLMQRELERLKSEKLPQQYSAPSGMDGKQFSELLSMVAKSAKEQPDSQRLNSKTFVDERDIDKDDFDKDGQIFCAYSTGYLIVDDYRQGFPVRTPFNNDIFFKFQGQSKSRDSKGKEVLNTYCAYMSRSKKEQQWLREHRYFGIKFFESATEAMSTDAIRAQKLARFIDSVMSMDQHQVILACKSYNVPVSENMRSMRVILATKMLEKTEEQGVDSSQRALQELNEEHLFLADPKKITQH